MARPTYSEVITQLNSRSLRHSLELVSLLSSVEFEGGPSSPFWSLVHCETVRLLAEAVIKSKAAWYKEHPIEASELPRLVSGANDALDDKRLKEIVSGGERQEMLYKLQRYFSRLAYIQIRPQQDPYVPLGRTLAVLESIPEQYRHELSPRLQQLIPAFSANIQDVFKMKTSDLIRAHLAVAGYCGRLGLAHLQQLPTPRIGSRFTRDQQVYVLRRLVEMSRTSLHLFRLTEEAIGERPGEHAREHLREYAGIFGRPITWHRELLGRREYQVGPESHRLSPLDRFPLVADEDGSTWYVPNVRCLLRSAPEVIHFTLNETCREIYETVRGELLEVSLRLMVEQRAPHLKVIPERRWATPKGGADGPDLLVIDHSQDPVVFAIEVKSRRMLPGTRYELLDEHLTENYADLWKALKQLPAKLAMVFSLQGGYAEYNEDLIRAREYPVYHLGIAGEAPFLFGELVEYRRSREAEFPLYGFDQPYAVMSVDSFERLIEVAVQENRPIASVLKEYVEDCRDMELAGTMAENFRQVELDNEKFFGFSFLEPLWP